MRKYNNTIMAGSIIHLIDYDLYAINGSFDESSFVLTAIPSITFNISPSSSGNVTFIFNNTGFNTHNNLVITQLL